MRQADDDGRGEPHRSPTTADFMDYWSALRLAETFPAGVDLAGQAGMKRLNAYRVALRAAAAAELAGDRTEAMALLAETFTELFYAQVGSGFGSRPYGFGPDVRTEPGLGGRIGGVFGTLASHVRGNFAGNIRNTGQKLGKRVDDLTAVTIELQQAMRVLALGIDYGRYVRFQRLTPQVTGRDEHRHVHTEYGYAPTREEFDDCQQFIITVALRLAEHDSTNAPPSWSAGR
jgi:hypothetical protein